MVGESQPLEKAMPCRGVTWAVVVVVVVGAVVVVVLLVEEVVVVVLVVVVVDVVGHGVVRGRHSRTNLSGSLSGLVPFGAVALAASRTMAVRVPACSGSVSGMKLPQAEPSREAGTAPASLRLTTSLWSRVGGWQAGRFGSVWLMQTATLSVQEPLPHSPSVSQGSPSVQETTRPPRTSGPGLSMPTTFNST
jgi:hypothetical protein